MGNDCYTCGGGKVLAYEVTFPPDADHPTVWTQDYPTSLQATIAANRVVGATWAKKIAATP